MVEGGPAAKRSLGAAGSRLVTLFLMLGTTRAEIELRHPTRRRIVEIVRENPGIPLNQLRSRMPLGWGTIYHHVWTLVKAGELETVAAGRRRLLYLPGSATRERLIARSLLEGETARAVARAILAQPGLSFKDLIARVGGSERAVYYHVKRLLDAGLVVSPSRTRHTSLSAAPRLDEHVTDLDARPHQRD